MHQTQKILRALRGWRDERAKKENAEPWRVLSNQTLSEIALAMPKTREDLMAIKGIKEKKCGKYGKEILDILHAIPNAIPTENPQETHSISTRFPTSLSTDQSQSQSQDQNQEIPDAFSVSAYLGILNKGLEKYASRIRGEISSIDIRGNYLFFSLKDKDDGSTISCFMWMNAYKMSGVDLKEGLEIIAGGMPEIYKPSGRLSFRADTAELVGEGALKMAYEKLRAKLEKEGLFSPDRKKAIPEYPQNIGIITSKTGAVIHDFLNNIGRFGFRIRLIDSRVEGALAVKELVASIREFKKQKNLDVLVIMRGGGSLESLQAFNNEMLVQEIASCPFPVIAGIGHDKDVPLAALAADHACSTPTAAAKLLNAGWEQAGAKVRFAEQKIFAGFETQLKEKIFFVERIGSILKESLQKMIVKIASLSSRFSRHIAVLGEQIAFLKKSLPKTSARIFSGFTSLLDRTREKISSTERMLALHNPERQLRLGWSIAFSPSGKILRSVKDISIGDKMQVRVSDGVIDAKVYLDRSCEEIKVLI